MAISLKGKSFLKLLDFTPAEIAGLIDYAAELKAQKKELERIEREQIGGKLESALDSAKTVGSVRLITASFENVPMDALRTSLDGLVAKAPDAVFVLATVKDGKVQLAASCGKTALSAGVHCGNLLKKISPIVGGGGGGRPDSATSGGKNPEALPEALSAAEETVASMLK